MKHAIKDQMGRLVEIPSRPDRIISLVPSQTELLHDLGLGERVVGITKFCIHPNSWFRSKTRVGGTKKLDIERIRALNPDLIIGNKEENSHGDIAQLERDFPVWMSDIYTLEHSLQMIDTIGHLTQTKSESDLIQSEIRLAFQSLNASRLDKLRALYLIWKNPLIAAGRNTFINDMLNRAGFSNCIEDAHSRYPEIGTNLHPDIVFLSSEPYPFKELDIIQMQQQFPKAKVFLVNGEIFSWYGSRLRHAPGYFSNFRRTVALDYERHKS